MSTVYLIHFSEAYKHAAHYLGYTSRPLPDRLADHRTGKGARLMEVVTQAGIEWECVRRWNRGTRALERRLKKQKNTPRQLCPVCRKAAREAK